MGGFGLARDCMPYATIFEPPTKCGISQKFILPVVSALLSLDLCLVMARCAVRRRHACYDIGERSFRLKCFLVK